MSAPDPAARFQPGGVQGSSEVVDPHRFDWPDGSWRGRPWHEAVLYEIHLGPYESYDQAEQMAAVVRRSHGLAPAVIVLTPETAPEPESDVESDPDVQVELE